MFYIFLRCLWKFCCKIHLFEMQKQIQWWLHQRFIYLNLKLYSAIFDYEVDLSEKKIVFCELCLTQRNFLAIWSYIPGLDKYNVSK